MGFKSKLIMVRRFDEDFNRAIAECGWSLGQSLTIPDTKSLIENLGFTKPNSVTDQKLVDELCTILVAPSSQEGEALVLLENLRVALKSIMNLD